LRRLRFTGPEIAETLEMALSTVSGILTRIGMGKLGRLGLEPAVRYERERPGELIHIDVKKLGRIQGGAGTGSSPGSTTTRASETPPASDRQTVGWECVHIAIDDATRLAYAEVLPDEKATPPSRFCAAPSRSTPPRHHRRAAHHRQRQRLHLDRARRRLPPARHPPPTHTPLPPQTNGKAERFIRTLLGGWAYGAIYRSQQRTHPPLTDGSGTTTINDDTQPSATSRPSPASTSEPTYSVLTSGWTGARTPGQRRAGGRAWPPDATRAPTS
jgi:hypothetical protein